MSKKYLLIIIGISILLVVSGLCILNLNYDSNKIYGSDFDTSKYRYYSVDKYKNNYFYVEGEDDKLLKLRFLTPSFISYKRVLNEELTYGDENIVIGLDDETINSVNGYLKELYNSYDKGSKVFIKLNKSKNGKNKYAIVKSLDGNNYNEKLLLFIPYKNSYYVIRYSVYNRSFYPKFLNKVVSNFGLDGETSLDNLCDDKECTIDLTDIYGKKLKFTVENDEYKYFMDQYNGIFNLHFDSNKSGSNSVDIDLFYEKDVTVDLEDGSIIIPEDYSMSTISINGVEYTKISYKDVDSGNNVNDYYVNLYEDLMMRISIKTTNSDADEVVRIFSHYELI